MVNWRTLCIDLAKMLRTNCKCWCQDRLTWPWRKDEKCKRCELLKTFDEAMKEKP